MSEPTPLEPNLYEYEFSLADTGIDQINLLRQQVDTAYKLHGELWDENSPIYRVLQICQKKAAEAKQSIADTNDYKSIRQIQMDIRVMNLLENIIVEILSEGESAQHELDSKELSATENLKPETEEYEDA